MAYTPLRTSTKDKNPQSQIIGNFVYLPNTFLQNPPIRHRGEDPKAGLGVFEAAVLGAIVLLARTGPYKQARHDFSSAQARQAIERHRPEGKRIKRQSQRDFESYHHQQFKDA